MLTDPLFMDSKFVLIVSCLVVSSCQKNATEGPAPVTHSAWWQPETGRSFDWYLGTPGLQDQFSTEVVDVDAFETSKEVVNALHQQGKKVLAYLSVGTLEEGRPDGALVPRELIGNIYPAWPQERWVDIRQIDKIKPWVLSRLNMIVQKGFDGIEPDNVDGYEQTNTGFPISVGDTKKYLSFLITEAHQRQLSIGQKNIPDLSAEFATRFDWALCEDAFFQGWQDSMHAYIAVNKPVFAVEYTDHMTQSYFNTQVCPKAASLHYFSILKNRDLSKWTYFCQ